MKIALLFFSLHIPLFIISQPMSPGQAIITHFTEASVSAPNGEYAFSIFDTENNSLVPFGVNWATNFYAPADPAIHDSWRGGNMGDVFGIAIDSEQNAYFTATKTIGWSSGQTVAGVAGDGGVYIMDKDTWLVTPFINTGNGPNEIRNSGVGLGNICHDTWHNQLFITNFEDGKIYRFDMNGTLLSTFDPFNTDDGSDGFAGLGEVLWGIELFGTDQNDIKLYFSVWNNASPASIYSVKLDLNGDFSGNEEFCFDLPDPGAGFSAGNLPVSDLTFDSFGNMYLCEKSTSFFPPNSFSGGAHNSRAFQYQNIGGIWSQSQQYLVGEYGSGNNTTGGVALGNRNTNNVTECEKLLWASGDALLANLSIYGAAGIPVEGNSSIGANASSIYVDVPLTTPFADKAAFGDIEIFSQSGCCATQNIIETHSDYQGYGVSCNGASDGFIDLTLPDGVYTFSWSNGSNSEDISGLTAGVYSVIVTDENNCESFIEIELTEPSILVLSDINNPSCFGDNNGSIDLTVSGGTGFYTYEWSNGATSEDLSNLGVGTYIVQVIDQNGCEDSIEVEIGEFDEIETSIQSFSSVSCYGGFDGSLNISVSGGSGGYSYSWSTGQTTQNISNLSAGIYNVQVLDNNGCIDNFSYEINQPDSLSFNNYINNSECGLNNGNIFTNISGGTPPYSYSWSNGASTQNVDSLSPGDYNLNVIDDNGCATDLYFEIIDLEPPPLLTSISQYNCELTTNLFASTIDDFSGPWEYIGNVNDVTISDPYSLNTTITVPDYGEYFFQYNACNNFDTVSVTFSCPPIIPNILTVNDDGNNDLFIIQNLNPEIYSQSVLTILNRWGRVVYRELDYGLKANNIWWDGKTIYHKSPFSSISPDRDFDANKRRIVNDGVYYYILDLYFKNREVKETYTGYVQILRN